MRERDERKEEEGEGEGERDSKGAAMFVELGS